MVSRCVFHRSISDPFISTLHLLSNTLSGGVEGPQREDRLICDKTDPSHKNDVPAHLQARTGTHRYASRASRVNALFPFPLPQHDGFHVIYETFWKDKLKRIPSCLGQGMARETGMVGKLRLGWQGTIHGYACLPTSISKCSTSRDSTVRLYFFVLHQGHVHDFQKKMFTSSSLWWRRPFLFPREERKTLCQASAQNWRNVLFSKINHLVFVFSDFEGLASHFLKD